MGPHFEVTDCDIYTSDHGVYLGSHGSGPHNADVGIAARNAINFGGDCYQIDSSSHVSAIVMHMFPLYRSEVNF